MCVHNMAEIEKKIEVYISCVPTCGMESLTKVAASHF